MNCTFECIESEDLLFALAVACNIMGLKRREYRKDCNVLENIGFLDDHEKELVKFYNDQISDIDISRKILLKIHDQLMIDVLKESLNELKETVDELKQSLGVSNG